MFDNLQGDNTTREVHGFLTMSVSGIIVMTGGGGGQVWMMCNKRL